MIIEQSTFLFFFFWWYKKKCQCSIGIDPLIYISTIFHTYSQFVSSNASTKFYHAVSLLIAFVVLSTHTKQALVDVSCHILLGLLLGTTFLGSFASIFTKVDTSNEIYGLSHKLLNLQSNSMWLNLGFWSNTKDFSTACQSLALLLADAVNLNKNDVILDVGFGCGDQILLWIQQFGVSKVVGLNVEESQVLFARQRFKDLGLSEQIELITESATKLGDLLEGRTDRFNKVLCLDSAYHFASRNTFLTQTPSLLCPGGKIGITDIVVPSSHLSMIDYILQRLVSFLTGIPRDNLWTIEEYTSRLEVCGYTQVQIFVLDSKFVFGGLSEFIHHQRKLMGDIVSESNWTFYRIVAWIMNLISNRSLFNYVVISAQKS